MKKIYPALIFLLFSASSLLWFHNGMIFFWDASVIGSVDIYKERVFSVFSDFRFPGIINPQIVGHGVYFLLFDIIKTFLGSEYSAQKLLFALLLFISQYSMFHFLSYIAETRGEKIEGWKQVLLVCLSIYYAFNLFSAYQNFRIFNLLIFLYSLSPLLLEFYLKSFSKKLFVVPLAVLLLLISPSISNIAYFPVLLLLVIIFFILFIEKKSKNFLWLIFLLAFSFFVLSFIIIPQLLLTEDIVKTALYGGDSWEVFSVNSSSSSVLQVFSSAFYLNLAELFKIQFFLSDWRVLAIFLFPVFALAISFLNRTSLQKRYILSTATFFLVATFFMVGAHEPFRAIWNYLFENFNFAMSPFRDIQQKLGIIYVFSVVFIWFEFFLSKKFNRLLISLFFIWLSLSIFPMLFGFHIQEKQANLIDEYRVVADVLNKDTEKSTVVVFPISATPLTFLFDHDGIEYSSFHPLQVLTNNPVIANHYGVDGVDDIYREILLSVANDNVIPKEFNIGYVLIDHRYNYQRFSSKREENFDFVKTIEANIKNNDNIEVIFENEQYSFYRVKNKDPLVECQSCTGFVSNEHESYTVFIRGLKNEETLYFKKLYSAYWAAYVGGYDIRSLILGKYGIPDTFHSENDAKLNSFLIDPEYIKKNFSKDQYHENADGSIDLELTLYFKPQSYFYLGLIVSGTTLAICLGYLGYVGVRSWREKKNEARSKSNLN